MTPDIRTMLKENPVLGDAYIYCVLNPEPMYVGSTTKPLDRLRSHRGARPHCTLIILEYVGLTRLTRASRERWWIAEMTRRGHILINKRLTPTP